LKQKNTTITNLHKDIAELKSQRAETALAMVHIQEQVRALKLNAKGENKDGLRTPLKLVNGNDTKSTSLTLKFDDYSDKLIIE
jgi:hypothetical protein